MDPSLSKAIVDFFMGIPLFSRMNAEEVKLVAKHMTVKDLQAGEILFREADEGSFMCFIASGELEVIKGFGPSGSEVVINTLGKGKSIGEMSVIESLPRSATIRARVSTKLYILSKPAFELILSRHANIGIKLLKGIATLLSINLRKTSNRLAEYMLPIS
ncbi:MAG: cyclic nucleotide-binding domain-containing protein [Desulfobacterales bacterium]